MVKENKLTKNETITKLLLAMLNVLLAGIFSLFLFFGNLAIDRINDIVISQQETTKAVNNLSVTIAIHSEKIEYGEQKDLHQDAEIELVKHEVGENKKRINILEDTY